MGEVPSGLMRKGLAQGSFQLAGKGQRFIILHAGSADKRFLPGCRLVFRGSRGSEDYHQEMKGKCFNDWFEHKLLPVLDNPSVIVLDKATYHNVRVPGIESPTMAWKKAQIIEWLQRRNTLHLSVQC